MLNAIALQFSPTKDKLYGLKHAPRINTTPARLSIIGEIAIPIVTASTVAFLYYVLHCGNPELMHGLMFGAVGYLGISAIALMLASLQAEYIDDKPFDWEALNDILDEINKYEDSKAKRRALRKLVQFAIPHLENLYDYQRKQLLDLWWGLKKDSHEHYLTGAYIISQMDGKLIIKDEFEKMNVDPATKVFILADLMEHYINEDDARRLKCLQKLTRLYLSNVEWHQKLPIYYRYREVLIKWNTPNGIRKIDKKIDLQNESDRTEFKKRISSAKIEQDFKDIYKILKHRDFETIDIAVAQFSDLLKNSRSSKLFDLRKTYTLKLMYFTIEMLEETGKHTLAQSWKKIAESIENQKSESEGSSKST